MDYVLIMEDMLGREGLYKKNDKRRHTKLTLDVLVGQSIKEVKLKSGNLYISTNDNSLPNNSNSCTEEIVVDKVEVVDIPVPQKGKFARGPMQFIDTGEFRDKKEKKLYNPPVERARAAVKEYSYKCSECGDIEKSTMVFPSEMTFKCNSCLSGKKRG